MQVETTLEGLLQVIGAQTVRIHALEAALAAKNAECERLIDEDAKRLQEEMTRRAESLNGAARSIDGPDRP